MNRMKLLAVALIFAATALLPARVPATGLPPSCGIQQCYGTRTCPPSVCPAGYLALIKCNTQLCYSYCDCIKIH
jgi:hypothetical protein